MKIAVIYGKGIDGCGVTRAGREIEIWAAKHGHEVKTYSYAERKFTRGAGHELNFVEFLKDDIANLLPELEKFDIVLLNSYPSAKNTKGSIDAFFYELVLKIEKPIIIGFMHELTLMNINVIPHLLGLMNACDVIYNFTEKSYFAKEASKLLPSKKLGQRLNKFTMWINFDEQTESLRRDISLADKATELLYIGRWTTMKDPRRVLDLGPLLKPHGISTRLLGIERSIGAKQDIFEHPEAYDLTLQNKQLGNPNGTPVYGPYVRKEGMESLAKTLFGCSFYRMPKDPEGYGDRMEYTQIEIIAVGSLPVFDLHWAENNRLKTGERYIDVMNSGIYSNKADLAETVEQLKLVAGSPEVQKKIRDTSYEIIRSEFDADVVLTEMFEHVLAQGKDHDKFGSIEEMLLSITGSAEYAEGYKELVRQDELVALGIKEVTSGILAVFNGKKREEVAKVKLPLKTKKNILAF